MENVEKKNDGDFNEFWYRYPKRVGKLTAQRAYTKARRQATAAVLLEGVERYIAAKPTWQAWAHPSSWLNAGRWLDEVTVAKAAGIRGTVCPHDPMCASNTACITRVIDDGRRERGV